MNIQKMYAVGKVVYVDMARYERAKMRLCLYTANGDYLPANKCLGGVHKELICATRKQSLIAYEGSI